MNVVKRSSSLNNACTACRRRKVKCIGNPCAFCLQKNFVCEFKQQNKRGPRALKLPATEIDEFQLELNHVQQYMGEVCQQNCFIDFYFQYIGRAVPLEYKQSLIAPTKTNFEYKPQMYIITASIMKLYGNEDAETLYITKAKRTSNLFDCDTLESSITLLMMALYLGPGTKAHNLILMAQNALKLPTIENSSLVSYVRGACQALSVTFDPSVSQQTKSAFVLGLFSYDISAFSSNHATKDLLEICMLRARHTMSNLMKFDDTSVSSFLQSVSLTTVQNEYNRSSILEELNKILELLKGIKYSESDTIKINNAHFIILSLKFIVEWRCGYKQAAYNAAINAFQFCKENLPALAIRISNMVSMLAIPYFMRGCGAADMETECLRYLESAYGSIGKTEQLKLTWAEMSGNLDSYKISQLETELLGNTEFLLFPDNNALFTNM